MSYVPIFRDVLWRALALEKASFSVFMHLVTNLHRHEKQFGAQTFKNYAEIADFCSLAINTTKKGLDILEEDNLVIITENSRTKKIRIKLNFLRANGERVKGKKGGYVTIPFKHLIDLNLPTNSIKIWIFNFLCAKGLYETDTKILNIWAQNDLDLSRSSVTKANDDLIQRGLQSVKIEEKSGHHIYALKPFPKKTKKIQNEEADRVTNQKQSENCSQKPEIQETKEEQNPAQIESNNSAEKSNRSAQKSNFSHNYKESCSKPLCNFSYLKGLSPDQLSEADAEKLRMDFQNFKKLVSGRIEFRGVDVTLSLFLELISNVEEFGLIQRSTNLVKIEVTNPVAYLLSFHQKYGLTAHRVYTRLQGQKKLGISTYVETPQARFATKHKILAEPDFIYYRLYEYFSSNGLLKDAIHQKIEELEIKDIEYILKIQKEMESIKTEKELEEIKEKSKQSLETKEETAERHKLEEEFKNQKDLEKETKTRVVGFLKKSAPSNIANAVLIKLVNDNYQVVEKFKKENRPFSYKIFMDEIFKSVGGAV